MKASREEHFGLCYQFLARHLTPVKIVAAGVSAHPAARSRDGRNDPQAPPLFFTRMVTDRKRASSVRQADNGLCRGPRSLRVSGNLRLPAGNDSRRPSSTGAHVHSKYFASTPPREIHFLSFATPEKKPVVPVNRLSQVVRYPRRNSEFPLARLACETYLSYGENTCCKVGGGTLNVSILREGRDSTHVETLPAFLVERKGIFIYFSKPLPKPTPNVRKGAP
ncbi:hypothetical protein KM043_016406 [Ampulex compressa]|nr:hypothetical protein KM043_016406 [Ampulex compressa]